jgi:hypothetical protein
MEQGNDWRFPYEGSILKKILGIVTYWKPRKPMDRLYCLEDKA